MKDLNTPIWECAHCPFERESCACVFGLYFPDFLDGKVRSFFEREEDIDPPSWCPIRVESMRVTLEMRSRAW